MARKLVKRDWGQAKGGYSPFAKSSPKAKTVTPKTMSVGSGCSCYEAYDRVYKDWFTQQCRNCR